MEKAKQKWAVVGGGILGMTIAHRLKQQGYQVTLFEADEKTGGLAIPWALNGIVWDKFYHVALLSDKYLRSLLRELNLENEINWVETKTGFFSNGKLYSMSNILEFLQFPPINLFDKFRLGLTILYASKVKNWERLEKIPVETWLRRLSGKNTFEKIWLPLLRSKLGDTYTKASAAFIWATIQRMYAARKSGLKKELFGYIPGGYKKILDIFNQTLLEEKVEIKSGHKAKLIERRNGNRTYIEFENGYSDSFDNIILTVPSSIAAKICPSFSEKEKNKMMGIQYLGVICASVLLKKPLSKYYVTNITDNGYPFTGVIEMGALVNPKYFNGNSLVYLPKYITPDDKYLNLSDEEIKEIFIPALMKMYPALAQEDIVNFKVARAKYVFALSTIDYSKKLPSIKTSIPGVFLLNNSYISNGTLNINETIQLAENELKSLIK